MRVILLADSIRPPLAGIGRYSWELAQGIARAQGGATLSLLSWGKWQSLDALRYKLAAAESQSPPAGRHGTAHLTSLLKRALGNSSAIASSYELMRRHLNGAQIQRFTQSDEVIVHGPDYFAPQSHLPTAVTIHDLSVLLYPETQPASRVKRFEVMIDMAITAGFTIFTDARSVARELQEKTGVSADRVHAVHLGVSSAFSPKDQRASEGVLARYGLSFDDYVLSVGTAEPRKNLVRLIDSYETLPSALRSRYPLVLAGGKGWNDALLLRRIERAKAAGWLRTLGYVPDSHLPLLYSGARLFAYASLYEGFGLPVAEAMACGTPVLTSNCSSMPEVADGAALLVNPLDIDDIAAGLACSLEDESWRRAARSRGMARAKELTWDNTVRATLAVYRKMLST